MLSAPVFAALFATTVVAQSSVVNLLVQDSDNDADELAASLVSADASLTTYVMNCQPTLDADDCGWSPGATFTVGSTTMDMILTDVDFTWSVHCSYSTTSATAAVCTNVYGGSEANDPGTEVYTYDGGDNGTAQWAGVTVTAGLDNAVAASTAASNSASATGSSSGAANTASSTSASAKDTQTGSVSGSASGSATAEASSKSSSTAASSSTSTGGVPQITAASFALGGAAMLMAIVAL